ncbi:hypothetical protein DFH09DRAFT_502070 [Mycena vulgaris]|nr:hypothetical protein DFH09DRAFT_502070 [Mycena vulgaris]
MSYSCSTVVRDSDRVWILDHPEPPSVLRYSCTPQLGKYADMVSTFATWQSIVAEPALDCKLATEVVVFELGMIISADGRLAAILGQPPVNWRYTGGNPTEKKCTPAAPRLHFQFFVSRQML